VAGRLPGTTPIGWIIAAISPRSGLAIGGASCFVAALGAIALARRFRPSIGGRSTTARSDTWNSLAERSVVPAAGLQTKPERGEPGRGLGAQTELMAPPSTGIIAPVM
jgi:hypothetical protein